jgi:uncharacterized protein YbjT (DUF2867 family)
MTTPMLVTGGTGTLGRLVVPQLRASGAQVRVLSRSPHPPSEGVEYVTGDLATGTGIAAALDGVGTVVHCAGSAKGDGDKARTLVRAASGAGVRHLVSISVVGADRVPVVSRLDRAAFGYFAEKRAGERIIEDSGIGWTTLRATQFHDLTLIVARQLAKLPVIPVPAGVRFQPVDAGEVATHLVGLALGEPSGLVPDVAGPEIRGMDDLVGAYLHAIGKQRPIVRVPMAGRAYRAVRAGATLAPDRAVGHRTWEDFLADKVPASSANRSGS